MSKRKEKPLHPELMQRLNAQNEAAADWPDGAWWASLENTVEIYNSETGNSYDPNDAVHKWVRTSGHFEQVKK